MSSEQLEFVETATPGLTPRTTVQAPSEVVSLNDDVTKNDSSLVNHVWSYGALKSGMLLPAGQIEHACYPKTSFYSSVNGHTTVFNPSSISIKASPLSGCPMQLPPMYVIPEATFGQNISNNQEFCTGSSDFSPPIPFMSDLKHTVDSTTSISRVHTTSHSLSKAKQRQPVCCR